MDQSFFLRAKRLLEQRETLRLDHRTFLAELAERQASTPTAAAAAANPCRKENGEDADTLCILVLGEDGWPGAAQHRGGCFSRAAAARRVNKA